MKRREREGLSPSPRDWTELEAMPRAALEARALARLRTLLRHAEAHVPRYARLLGELPRRAWEPESLEDLARIPPLGREEARRGFASGDLRARGLPGKRRELTHTTGSTGVPLWFESDRASREPRRRAWKLLDRWAGIASGDARVWLSVPRPRPTWSWRRPLHSAWRSLRFRQPPGLVNVLGLEPRDTQRVLAAIERDSTYYIYGIASAIQALARQGSSLGSIVNTPPRAIVGTSDSFLARDRSLVADFFQAPAYSRYGAYEVGGGVAQTCPAHGDVHHVISELVILEVVDSSNLPVKPGERGRVLLTDLTNEVMPFIRYDTGDEATAAGPCPCGRPWPTVGEIHGRVSDAILCPNGVTRPAWELETHLFYDCDFKHDIAEYQVYQRDRGALELRVVPLRPLRSSTVERLRSAVMDVAGNDMAVSIREVDAIPRSVGGKRRLVVRDFDASRAAPPIDRESASTPLDERSRPA